MLLERTDQLNAGDAPSRVPDFDPAAMGLRMMRAILDGGGDPQMPTDPSVNVHFASQFHGPSDVGDAARGRGGELSALLLARSFDADRADRLRRARRAGFLPPAWSPDAVLLDSETFGL
jgi:hypothetical protein